ncbi:MAG: hypothetical protein P4L33_11385 [Capsulimonadaceae bacterium]|nr:hypothetical protein [Capsulimonadaceae bacterium]
MILTIEHFVGRRLAVAIAVVAVLLAFPHAPALASSATPVWDTYSDTWVGVDALGRALPTYEQVGPPRADRQVAIFGFLWHGYGTKCGPYDITKILATAPDALTHPESPAWGPLAALHYWGEPMLGYYRDEDPYVVRKHAQMLTDAGVDAVIFDNSNKETYRPVYMAMLSEYDRINVDGGRTPKVAFLCPFGDPASTVNELYNDLYKPGLYSDHWYRRDGKPLILADEKAAGVEYRIEAQGSNRVPAKLETGRTLGVTFHADKPFETAEVSLPTWNSTNSAATLTLREQGPGGKVVAKERLTNIVDNLWRGVTMSSPAPAGDYYIELSDPAGEVGWWSSAVAFDGQHAFVDGGRSETAAGGRSLRLSAAGGVVAEFDVVDIELKEVPCRLDSGITLGATFHAGAAFDHVGGHFPTWNTTGSGATLTLREGDAKGRILAQERLDNIIDNEWRGIATKSVLPAGDYYLELSEPVGTVGWWSINKSIGGCRAFVSGAPSDASVGSRELFYGASSTGANAALKAAFTFRAPQADYFRGPTKSNMWSWLEVYPQHVFKNDRGENEQMSVGVAQNAADGHLDVMSNPKSLGRSYALGSWDTSAGAVNKGRNFAEQFEYALQKDPKVIFITGWNEWVASGCFQRDGAWRFDWNRKPGDKLGWMDEFDEEHSRDIEPMRGGHGDDYYYQMVSFIRRYKGVRPLPAVSPRTIAINGRFDQWKDVRPEFRHEIGGEAHRDFDGNGNVHYTNNTGRNNIISAKVCYDSTAAYFYARTRNAITKPTGNNWMLLFLNIDGNYKTGWLGYDYVINRIHPTGTTAYVERCKGNAYAWEKPAAVSCRYSGSEMEIRVPYSAIGGKKPVFIDFKWADNCLSSKPCADDFTLNGDAAPDGRFNYRAKIAASRERLAQ